MVLADDCLLQSMEEPKMLDDSILQEILLRLPVKTIAKFKTVSKRWLRLISETYFLVEQAERSRQRCLGILTATVHPMGGRFTYFHIKGDKHDAPDTSLGFPRLDNLRVSVKAACNGLIFFELFTSDIDRIMIVGNPTTKSYKKVPRVSLPVPDAHFGLAFDPSVSISSYKIVACMRWTQRDMTNTYNFVVYSPATSWKSSEAALTTNSWQSVFDIVNSVFFNRSLHWLEEGGNIVAFNIDEGKARNMAAPKEVSVHAVGGYPNVWLGIASGCMSLVKFICGEIYVWVMVNYDESRWELRQKIKTEGAGGYYRKTMPIYYDGELCTFLTWGSRRRRAELGFAVYRTSVNKWDKIRKVHGTMDCSRHFIPYYSHMLG